MKVSDALPVPLSGDELLVLAATKIWFMQCERAAEHDLGRQHLKGLLTDRYFAQVAQNWTPDTSVLARERDLDSVPAWQDLVNDDLRVLQLWSIFDQRERALLSLLELVAFSPWGPVSSAKYLTEGETSDRRTSRLKQIAQNVGALLSDDDRQQLDERLPRIVSLLARLPRDVWKRRAVVAFAGLGGAAAGAVTGGLAAPAVGSALGSSMGLSGAAATNAGLALLGGGSIASGGFGMAGGSIVVAGTAAAVGGIGGAGVGVGTKAMKGTGTDYLSTATHDDVLGDTAKLVVTTELVVGEGDPAGRRRASIAARLAERRDHLEQQLDNMGGARRMAAKPSGLERKWLILDAAVKRLRTDG